MSALLPYSFARKHNCFLQPNTGENDQNNSEKIKLITTQATTVEAVLEVMRITPSAIEIEKLDDEKFTSAIQSVYSTQSDTAIGTMGEDFDHEDLAGVISDIGEPEDLLENNSDAPIIRVLNAVLGEAIRELASDVHFEPTENELRIRFRIDGALVNKHTIPLALAPLVVSRVKVMAKLDIAEKRLPQDGRVSIRLGTNNIDLRVSLIPSSYGERAVLRILDKSAGRISIDKIGMSSKALSVYSRCLSQPNGIILVTGPTGSGKTTTLYAGLDSINREDVNIMTVEDPVEYNLRGISQTQVNAKTNMDFTKALRAILRQDPDIIMIGEIRDAETASISVQASLTGHLVLSTLHTNSAIGAISRMRDIGVEPFLLASSLSCVVSQRLVRRLCPSCRTESSLTKAEELLIEQPIPKVYRSKGCEKCSHSGFQGRIGLYEAIPIDATLEEMIYKNASEAEMENYAHKLYPSLKDSCIDLVLEGVTTLEEMQRVTTVSTNYDFGLDT